MGLLKKWWQIFCDGLLIWCGLVTCMLQFFLIMLLRFKLLSHNEQFCKKNQHDTMNSGKLGHTCSSAQSFSISSFQIPFLPFSASWWQLKAVDLRKYYIQWLSVFYTIPRCMGKCIITVFPSCDTKLYVLLFEFASKCRPEDM